MNVALNIKNLLWDVDAKKVDASKHKSFLISRISEKGGTREIAWLRRQYSDKDIKKIVAKSRNVSAKTKNFWKLF
ncbi:hypothetical protein EPN28_01445 [Patescibacteria group bacterium]|nr:MAG: hypothetical protein EPN28_01445 [Patescibacteria group bacterium]